MPQPAKGARLGGSAAHEKLLLINLAKSLFEHGRITTTEAKARRLRPVAERFITKAKKGDIHNRRLVLQSITDKGIVHTLFTEIARGTRTAPVVTPASPRSATVVATTPRWPSSSWSRR